MWLFGRMLQVYCMGILIGPGFVGVSFASASNSMPI